MGMFDNLTVSTEALDQQDDPVKTLDLEIAHYQSQAETGINLMSQEDLVEAELSDLEDVAEIVSDKGLSPDLFSYLNRDGSLESLFGLDEASILSMEKEDLEKALAERLDFYLDDGDDLPSEGLEAYEKLPMNEIENKFLIWGIIFFFIIPPVGLAMIMYAIFKRAERSYEASQNASEEDVKKVEGLVGDQIWSNSRADENEIRGISRTAMMKRFNTVKELKSLKDSLFGDLPKTPSEFETWTGKVDGRLKYFTDVYGLHVDWTKGKGLLRRTYRVKFDKSRRAADQVTTSDTPKGFGYTSRSITELQKGHLDTLQDLRAFISAERRKGEKAASQADGNRRDLTAEEKEQKKTVSKAVRVSRTIFRMALDAYRLDTQPLVSSVTRQLVRRAYSLEG